MLGCVHTIEKCVYRHNTYTYVCMFDYALELRIDKKNDILIKLSILYIPCDFFDSKFLRLSNKWQLITFHALTSQHFHSSFNLNSLPE